MNSLINEVPQGLNVNHEKFLKFFSKKAFISAVGIAPISIILILIFKNKGNLLIGIILALIPQIISFILTSIHLPLDFLYTGGGLTLDNIVIRWLLLKSKRYVYSLSAYTKEKDDL